MPEAVEVITATLTLSDGVHLFPNATGGPGRVDSGLNRSLRLIFGDVDGHPTPHSARHTVATELERTGCEEGEIARVLGHASTSVTGRAAA